jgi:gamma-glutamyltranspeptidase/glutathione hydrolase
VPSSKSERPEAHRRHLEPTPGVVASGHAQTSEAGARMLRAGGNAVDAAVAAAWASFVAEPVLGSPGGGGFMTVWDGDTGACVTYDFFANVPGLGIAKPDASRLDFFDVEISFGPATQRFHIGRGAAAVPGCIGGLWEAHRAHGRLNAVEVLEPAIELCREGAVVSESMAGIFQVLEPIVTATGDGRALFAPEGRLLRTGEKFRNPDLAETLEYLAHHGPEPFYSGSIAGEIADTFGPKRGGLLTEQDLAAWRVEARAPLEVTYRGRRVLLNPGPSAGGPLIAFSLLVLSAFGSEELRPRTLRRYRLVAEVMAATNRARPLLLAGASAEEVKALAREAVAAVRAVLDGAGGSGGAPEERSGRGSTTHVSAVDAQGSAAAVTVSNGESCGYVLPGRGVLLNNFLGEEDINPGGFHQSGAGGRMRSMMCPTVVQEADGRTALGTGGSNRIRSAILQVLVNLIDAGEGVEGAVFAPRIHHEAGVLSIESWDLDDAVDRALRAAYPHLAVFTQPSVFFGGVHVARYAGGQLAGTGDRRRGGVVARVG